MTTQRLVALSDDERERLNDALTTLGEGDLAEQLDLSRVSLLRAACGLGILRATRKAIVSGLDELDEAADDDQAADSGDATDADDADEDNPDEDTDDDADDDVDADDADDADDTDHEDDD